MAPDYPWYCVVDGHAALEQGDLLRQFPTLVPSFSLLDEAEDLDVDVETFNVIVMSHSCDLANDKIKNVVLCAHVDFVKAAQGDAKLKGREKDIQSGKHLRHQLLAESQTAIAMPLQLLDYGQVFSLPKALVHAFAKKQGARLRLLPPYREHVAQTFAMCYMRVALPVPPLDTIGPSGAAPAWSRR